MNRPFFVFLVICTLFFSITEKADAQIKISRLTIEGHIGTGFYLGERGARGATGIYWAKDNLGSTSSLGMAYSIWDSIDLVGNISYSDYPGIHEPREGTDYINMDASSQKWKGISGSVRYRFLPLGVYEPFVSMGFTATVGNINNSRAIGLGPSFGLGISRPFLGLKISVAGLQHYVFPNKALDLAGSGRKPDVLSSLLFGVSYRFREKKPKMEHVTITAPNSLDVGNKGIFSVSTDLDPVAYSTRWEFGDGSIRTGHSVEFAYEFPGTYVAKVTVFNVRSSTSSRMEIVVHPTFERIVLVSISVSPLKPIIGDDITFSPLMRGQADVCEWTFGDGTTSSSCETNHSYSSSGIYRVTFSASNENHSASSIQNISVQTDVCSQLPDLSAVYFSSESSELALDMRQVLRENMSTSSACTERPIEVVGYALISENNPRRLAERRASEVIQYYRNLGIPSSRVFSGSVFVIPDSELVGLPRSARTVSYRLAITNN